MANRCHWCKTVIDVERLDCGRYVGGEIENPGTIIRVTCPCATAEADSYEHGCGVSDLEKIALARHAEYAAEHNEQWACSDGEVCSTPIGWNVWRSEHYQRRVCIARGFGESAHRCEIVDIHSKPTLMPPASAAVIQIAEVA
jgi:hypothetical protein